MSETTSDQQRFTFKMDERSGKPVNYANFAIVDLTPFEAIISFGLADPATAQRVVASGGEDVPIEAVTVARIALPHVVFARLSQAMEKVLETRPELRGAAPTAEA